MMFAEVLLRNRALAQVELPAILAESLVMPDAAS
jgi:hypothetical protein